MRLLAIVCLWLTGTAEAATVQSSAIVRIVKGNVWDGQGQAVPLGFKASPGTIIATSTNSSVDFFLGDAGPLLHMTGATRLGFKSLEVVKNDEDPLLRTGKVVLELEYGSIFFNLKPSAI